MVHMHRHCQGCMGGCSEEAHVIGAKRGRTATAACILGRGGGGVRRGVHERTQAGLAGDDA